MKVAIQSHVLQEKLSFLNRAVSGKSQLPILLNMYIEATKTALILRTTDLEIGIETTIPVQSEIEGACAVPAKTFSELVQSLPHEDISLISDEKALSVISKKTKSVFQTMNSEEFPKLYEERGVVAAVLKREDLQKNFQSVVFSASLDTARPALSGVLVKKEASGFLLVATDGYRLSLKHYSVSSEGSESRDESSILIPARAFREVLATKEGEEVLLHLAQDRNQVAFVMDGTTLVGRLIDAEFPHYEKIIPSDFSSQITFDREELLKAVKICSIFARDAANIIKCSLKKDKIIVSSQTPSLGENTVEVEAQLTGEENDIAFNARYLLDVLTHVGEDNLVLEMTGPLNPGVFKVQNDASFLHLIMPIRVQQ